MKMKAKAKDVLRFCRRFCKAREAVSALEYAILVGVIVAAVAGALIAFSGNINTAVTGIGTKVQTGAGTAKTVDLDP